MNHNNRDNLEQLDGRRATAIVAASVSVFGSRGYQNARTADIARAAGMSKSALFLYFKNKRTLYEYVVDAVYEKAVAELIDERFWAIDDFFERMLYIGESKQAYFDARPSLVAFALRAFYPSHRDVRKSMGAYSYGKVGEMLGRFFNGVDLSRFKDDCGPEYVTSMLVWLADGWMHERIALDQPVEMGALMAEFRQWCAMLRTAAYREECL